MNNEQVLKKYKIYDEVGDDIGYVSLLQYMGSDLTVVNAARASYDKYKDGDLDEKDQKLMSYLIDNKHTSTLEHNVMTFVFKVPLYVSKQHMRHRTWSFNEISRRYTEENIEFYIPKKWRTQAKTNKQSSIDVGDFNPIVNETHGSHNVYQTTATEAMKQLAIQSERTYEMLLDSGVCREQARGALLNCLYTTYWGTIDLNNFFKFLDLRSASNSQWEIRVIADALNEIASDLFPLAMDKYNEQRKLKEEFNTEFQQWKKNKKSQDDNS